MTHDEALLAARGGELVQLASESSKRIESTTGAILGRFPRSHRWALIALLALPFVVTIFGRGPGGSIDRAMTPEQQQHQPRPLPWARP